MHESRQETAKREAGQQRRIFTAYVGKTVKPPRGVADLTGMKLKFGAILLLLYLAYGTICADRLWGGRMTAGYSLHVAIAGAVLALLLGFGFGSARNQPSLGMSRFQWGLFPVALLGAGVAVRFYLM